MKKLMIALLITFLPFALMAAPKVGRILSPVVLEGSKGGLVKGGAWDSAASFKGKVTLFFYVDPDEKSLNAHAVEAFKKEKRESKKFQAVVVINMDSTWLPNSAIESSLESSQKENPNTIYIKDMKKALV
ncbi:MAG: YtfJ family protein, partial [SAR324 cluster bacterium]|nr:YtfJ family protein [SAR324 cluster bacterium]